MKIEKILIGARKLDFEDEKTKTKIMGTQLFLIDPDNLIDNNSVQSVDKVFLNDNLNAFDTAKELLCENTDVSIVPIVLDCTIKGNKVIYKDIII